MKKSEYALVICQMSCAHQFFSGGGVDIDYFITSNGLNTKEFAKIAEDENFDDVVLDAIKRNI